MSKRPNDRKGEIPQDRALERPASTTNETAPQGGTTDAQTDALDDVRVLIPHEPIAKPQPDRDGIIPAAMASLWRAMLALPTGHPALRSLQKCEDADLAEAVPMLKMCAAALRLVHLQASAEHVERAMELLSGLRSVAA